MNSWPAVLPPLEAGAIVEVTGAVVHDYEKEGCPKGSYIETIQSSESWCMPRAVCHLAS